MNLMIINSYDCSAAGAGGVNQVTVALSRYFTHHYGINCYLGFFEQMDQNLEPLPEIIGRIQLNRHLDEQAFKNFLQQNKIDIVQVNYLRKDKIYVMRDIYRIAHQCGVKVIHAFHMEPAFQIGVYASWDKVLYSIKHKERIWENVKFWLYNVCKPLIDPFVISYLRSTYKMQFESCDKLVTLSQYFIEPFMHIAGETDMSKCTAIGNSLRYSVYPTEQEIRNKEKIVLVLQRLSEDTKRISLSIRAWKRIEQTGLYPDWKMQVVGDGKDAAYFRHLATKLKIERIEFVGHQDPFEYAKNASIFVIASATEGWGLVITETMQMGCPTVAMDSFAALHDIVIDGYNGLIVPNGDMDAYYEAILNLMGDDAKRLQMAYNAMESSKRFEIDKVAAKWKALFEELMQDKK